MQVVDNIFCIFFCFEITVRYFAYQQPCDAFKALGSATGGKGADMLLAVSLGVSLFEGYPCLVVLEGSLKENHIFWRFSDEHSDSAF